MKKLAEEFKGQFQCFGENTKKCINLLVPIKKKLKMVKTVTDRIKFIETGEIFGKFTLRY